MGLTTSGRDMAGLVQGGRGGFSVKMGVILPILCLIDFLAFFLIIKESINIICNMILRAFYRVT